MDKGHGDRSLQPWCPTAIPEARGGHGCRAALALHGLGQAHDREASRWSSPIPVVPGLGAAPAPWQPPVPPPGAQPWDGRGLLCRGLCPALGQGTPQGSTSAGREVTPAVPTPPRPHNTPGPPRTLHGPCSASFHPPSAPREERGQRQSHGTLPPCRGRSQGSSRSVPLDLHFSLSVSRCKRPPPR